MELLHRRCCGLDVHKETVVACLRLVSDGKVTTEVRTFQTTTADLLRLSEWLAANECTHVAMEATGIYWKPVWHILDDGEFALVLANAAHVKNVPGRKTDVNDAMWLAELLAHGLIRASFVPDAQTQEVPQLQRDPRPSFCGSSAKVSGTKMFWQTNGFGRTSIKPTFASCHGVRLKPGGRAPASSRKKPRSPGGGFSFRPWHCGVV